jgi:hypothetical protein
MRQSIHRSCFTRISDPRLSFKAWRRQPSLEMLENRLALAATTFVNDNWHLVTDNGDNVLSVGDTVRNDNDTINPSTNEQ